MAPLAVKVVELPAHITVGDAKAPTVGIGTTSTDEVAELVHVPLLEITVYVVFEEGV